MSESMISEVPADAPANLPENLERLSELALDEARKNGATQAEVGVSSESGLSVSVRLGDVETIEHNRDKGMSITVYMGQRKGASSTSDFSEGAIAQSVRAACDIARYTEEDDCAGLADAELMATDIPDLDLMHAWDVSAEQAIEIASECESAARDYDEAISNSEGATVSSHSGTSVYANSHGFCANVDSSRHSLSCSVIAGEGDSMQRDYWYSVARNSEDLDSAEAVGQRAAQRTVRRLGARTVTTGTYPVLFSPEMSRSLINALIGAISGGALYRKTSFLLDRKGEQIFAPIVNISESPLLPRELGSSAFDAEGVARRNRNLVSEGVLQDYVLSSYSSRKLGLVTTGNAGGVRNVIVQPGENSPQDMLKQMDRGFLVTEMMGSGANLTTGDYSRGAAGFWVENGEIVHPVEEVTVAGNLLDMFQRIEALGNDVDKQGNIHTGSVLVGSMTVAGG
ncbi:MAG: metalloprotease PmbA [Pseudomonadota bacterium]